MLLRPSNTLLLDEPTNHLDIDSTNVLLDALVDYGGTLIFVSHDRYFVDRLASKVLEIGDGDAALYLGGYKEFRWSKQQRSEPPPDSLVSSHSQQAPSRTGHAAEHKKNKVETRRYERRLKALQARISVLEERISDRERAVRSLEQEMARPSFYENESAGQEATARHQALMWEVGDLMNQWEAAQNEAREITGA